MKTLVVAINSFNSTYYVLKALALRKEIEEELTGLSVTILIMVVFGGAQNAYCRLMDNHGFFCAIEENLSDYNVFVAVERFASVLPPAFTLVCLHDTCTIKRGVFGVAMRRLTETEIDGWIFAHSLGLYNLGVCDREFALTHARHFDGIVNIPKNKSIQLEHSRDTVTILAADGCTRNVPGLRSFSSTCLNGLLVADGNVDLHSIMPVNDDHGDRHVVYISSFGVFKHSHTPMTYLLPILASNLCPQTQRDYKRLTRSYENGELSPHEWVRALVPFAI